MQCAIAVHALGDTLLVEWPVVWPAGWLWWPSVAVATGAWGLLRIVAQRNWDERRTGHLVQLATVGADGLQPPSRAVDEGELPAQVIAWQQRRSASLAELQQRRAEIEESGAYKTAFLRAVAHELRTPLNGILGFADLLLTGIEGPLSDDRRANLQVVSRAARQLLERFNDAIELSTMASGQLSLRRERVHLGELIQAEVVALQEQRGESPVHISLEGDEGALWVLGQKDRLERVLSTIGRHCLARTRAGLLRFSIHAETDWIEVAVLDSGPGFSQQEAQALFSPDLAGDSEARRTALRLTIAQQLVVLHGGSLTACASPRGGSLRLRLPRAARTDHRLVQHG